MALRGFTDYEADGSAISGSFAAGYIYATEIFPTVVRNIGAGLSTQFANMGALIAPQLLLLTAGGAAGGEEESVAAAAACGGGDLGAVILVFGMMATLGAALVLLLPETLGAVLPDSLQDIERSGEVPRVLDWLLGSWEQADAGPVLWRARGGRAPIPRRERRWRPWYRWRSSAHTRGGEMPLPWSVDARREPCAALDQRGRQSCKVSSINGFFSV